MRQVYVFSGLGADERVFKFIDWEGFSPVYIKWIIPIKNESLQSYTIRLKSQITSENPILLGMSFGGILAIEMSKLINTKKIILISSVKSKYELPFYYKMLGFLSVPLWFPLSYFIHGNKILYNFFGIKTRGEKILLNNILRDTPLSLLRFALQCAATWKNVVIPKNIIHIHGDKDLILPYRKIKSDITIKNGGHFLIVNKSKEVSKVLKSVLNDTLN